MAHPHPLAGAIAQSDGTYRQGGTPRTPTSPTIEHYLRAGEARAHDMEDDHGMHHHKKSVLAKVKEKARKWRSTLSKKKHGEDGKSTPSWGVSLEDEEEEEEDAEYLGAPMYESEMAPEELKETARQHPRAVPVISESHVLSSSVNVGSEEKSASAHKPMAENLTEKQEHVNSPKTLTETVTEKLAPTYATISDATHAIASKIQSLTVSTPEPSSAPAVTNPPAVKTTAASPMSAPASMSLKQTSPSSAPASMALKETSRTTTGSGIQAAPTHAPAATTMAPTQAQAATTAAPIQAPAITTAATTAVSPGSSEQIWEKGVLVKEYIMHKLEPGDDEKALSQVISQAITPKNNPGDGSVMEKVKEVVTSFLHNEESEAAFSTSNEKSTSRIPLSTNAHEGVEEENHGRVLQAN